jgi:hypothetical protein
MSCLEGENRFLRIVGVCLQDQPVTRPKRPQHDIFRRNAVLATLCYFLLFAYIPLSTYAILGNLFSRIKKNSETEVGDK